jgi:phospholipid/cholesterol/gamma-HCH transport system permease protein
MGLVGGYLIGTTVWHISSGQYINTTLVWLLLPDIFAGLLKSVIFAVIIGMVGCYRALVVEGGAEGVGQATMVSVVTTIVLIIVADGVFTAILT